MTVALQEHVFASFVPFVDGVNHPSEPDVRAIHEVEIMVIRLYCVFPGRYKVYSLRILVLDVCVRVAEHERAIAPKVVRTIAMAFSLSVVNYDGHYFL
jgi:hypothetical protein